MRKKLFVLTDINPDDLPIRLFEHKLRYIRLLKKILKVFPPDLAMIHKIAKTEIDYKDEVSNPFKDFREKSSWYNTIRRLSTKEIGLVELKISEKNAQTILISEISFTPLWGKVIDAWKDSILFQFLDSVPLGAYKTPQHYTRYILPNLLLYQGQKIKRIDISKSKSEVGVKKFEISDRKSKYLAEISLKSDIGSKKNYNGVKCVVNCEEYNHASTFTIKPETYFKYLNSGKKFKRGCRHCAFPEKRTRFIIDFKNKTLEIEQYYTDNDLKQINPSSIEEFELTEEQKEKITYVFSPDYSKISVEILIRALSNHEYEMDDDTKINRLNIQTLKFRTVELYREKIENYSTSLAVLTNITNNFSTFLDGNIDHLLKEVVDIFGQLLKEKINSKVKKNRLQKIIDLTQNYLEEKRIETIAIDEFNQKIPSLFKGLTEEVIRYVFKKEITAEQKQITKILYDLASERFISVYTSQYLDKININLAKEILENAMESINISWTSHKIMHVLDFRALIYKSINRLIEISYHLNKYKLNKELIIKRIFINSDKLLGDLLPNYQDKKFLEKELKLYLDLELSNQISLAQGALDCAISKKVKNLESYFLRKTDNLIAHYNHNQKVLLQRKQAIIKTIKSIPVIFQEMLEAIIYDASISRKKKWERQEIERYFIKLFRLNGQQLTSSDRSKALKYFKIYVNELLGPIETIKTHDLIKLEKKFKESVEPYKRTVLGFVREFEGTETITAQQTSESEKITLQQRPENSKLEEEILRIAEIKTLLTNTSTEHYDKHDLKRELSELNNNKAQSQVKCSDLIYYAIKETVERKLSVVELKEITKIVLEAVSSNQERLFILWSLAKTLRKASVNSEGDLVITKSNKRLHNIWHES